MATITIPQKLIRKGDIVVISKKEYEQFLKLRQRLGWEEKDTDEAVRVFRKERRGGQLKFAAAFASILK